MLHHAVRRGVIQRILWARRPVSNPGYVVHISMLKVCLMPSLPIKSWSKYYQESSAELKTRYEEKMRLLECREDPYSRFDSKGKGKTVDSNSLDWTCWPEVTYPDIYNYLILTPGITHEQLKSFKNMEEYSFYTSGKVTNINVTELPSTSNNNYLFTALVKHSQALSVPSVRVWIGVKQCGEVICAHCTCMAGASVGRYQHFASGIRYYKFKTVFGISRYFGLVQIHKLHFIIGIFVA